MNVKEKIYGEIDKLPQNELALLYEQIKLVKKTKIVNKPTRNPITIEDLHRYTSSSKTSWADDIIKHRDDRI